MTKPSAESGYEGKIRTEGQHWDNFSLRLLREGVVPFCCDFRLHLTQLLTGRTGLPFHLGAGLLPTRFREVESVLGSAASLIALGRRDILDLGSGGGWLSLELARQGGHVRGLDVSPRNIELARFFASRNEASRPYLYPRFVGLPLHPFGKAEYARGDLNRPLDALPESSIDIVTVWDALHHVRDLRTTFAEVERILRKDGVFLGHDFVGPTNETLRIQEIVDETIKELFRKLSAPELRRFREHLVQAAALWPLGVNAVDRETHPAEGAKGYLDSLVEELRERFALDDQVPPPVESPFEEVSIDYLLSALSTQFDVKRFYSMGAWLPENMPPPPDDPDDLGGLFFHYLSWLFLRFDDLLIESGAATGRWFCFAAVKKGSEQELNPMPASPRPCPESPETAETTAEMRLLRAENRVLRRLLEAPPGPTADAHRFYFKVVRPFLRRILGRK